MPARGPPPRVCSTLVTQHFACGSVHLITGPHAGLPTAMFASDLDAWQLGGSPACPSKPAGSFDPLPARPHSGPANGIGVPSVTLPGRRCCCCAGERRAAEPGRLPHQPGRQRVRRHRDRDQHHRAPARHAAQAGRHAQGAAACAQPPLEDPVVPHAPGSCTRMHAGVAACSTSWSQLPASRAVVQPLYILRLRMWVAPHPIRCLGA